MSNQRVFDAPSAPLDPSDVASNQILIEAEDESALALSLIRVPDGGTFLINDDTSHHFVLALEGFGQAVCGTETSAIKAGIGLQVCPTEAAALHGEATGLVALHARVRRDVARHAPLGPVARFAAVDIEEAEAATGSRSFQVLFGPENGSEYATLFIGYVPPGRAPWHFHFYDEIVWIWNGAGAFHLSAQDLSEPFSSGSTFRIRPREVHTVENASNTELVLVGLFTPAGSPSAAYYA